ncbi:uncharacterized protein DNG_08298 [Cephalotrichum gorgonifer]|uniref:Protein root UVB sensitive/RUS domain-containing protein n=1 Tax=Cephalotrichum gorgonifer TaxID=2041049 RepID=A0AAE8SY79_9PEZI|nr:uncharacterized protein DNG_08298 [Cephalotrichum gorgonifer]
MLQFPTQKKAVVKKEDGFSTIGDGEVYLGDKFTHIVELDRAGVIQRKWVHGPNNSLAQVELPHSSGKIWRSLGSWREPLFDAFLPVGFPHSVSPDYLAYQTFDSLQAFFSTITSMLANRALLEGLGVGDASSSATYALLLTVLKDAMSRVATIAFAHRFGLAIEPECKSYRFMADLFNDSAFFLDLVSPVLGGVPKVVVLSTAEALRALCGVAAGASKAALSSHFARQDNLAELNAKEASQETAIGLIGLLVGTMVVKLVEDRATVFYLMVTLVFVHLLMNYLGVRYVTLRTLNRQRAAILFYHWAETGQVLTPSGVSSRENIIFWLPVVKNEIGERVASVSFARDYAGALAGKLEMDILRCPSYWLVVRHSPRADIRILMMEDAEPGDVIEAWFSAMEVARGLKTVEGAVDWDKRKRYPGGSTWAPLLAPDLRGKLERAGWDLSSATFETGAPVRIRVGVAGKKNQ